MIDKRQTRPRCHAYLPSGTRVSSLLPRASATQNWLIELTLCHCGKFVAFAPSYTKQLKPM